MTGTRGGYLIGSAWHSSWPASASAAQRPPSTPRWPRLRTAGDSRLSVRCPCHSAGHRQRGGQRNRWTAVHGGITNGGIRVPSGLDADRARDAGMGGSTRVRGVDCCVTDSGPMRLRAARPTLDLPADPAATEHGRQAARSVVVRVGSWVTLCCCGASRRRRRLDPLEANSATQAVTVV